MEENKLLHLLKQHWSKCILALLIVACLAVWTERLFKSNQQNANSDFLTAQRFFERFQKGDFFENEALLAAENLLKRHPELHAKYDPLLMLTLFSQHKNTEALDYAKLVVDRAAQLLPSCYQDYAQTSLLIAEGHYQQAWNQALALDEKIDKQADYTILDGMNKLRLFFLADQLNELSQKELYWKALTEHPAFLEIDPIFHEGAVSLANYQKTL